MLTKKQFCEAVIDEYKSRNKVNVVSDESIGCSSLAVAMEYLGLLKSDSAKEYARTRSGILFTHRRGSLSARDILGLLPD